MKIYVAPISSQADMTLRALGETWEELALILRDKEETFLSGALLTALPAEFGRSEFVSITLPRKHARRLLDIAGLSS